MAEVFPLSPHQRGLWSDEPGAVSWCALTLSGELDGARLRQALEDAAQRHEGLRTLLRRRPGIRVPVQEIRPHLGPAWREEAAAGERSALAEACRRPFDLEEGPVLRV